MAENFLDKIEIYISLVLLMLRFWSFYAKYTHYGPIKLHNQSIENGSLSHRFSKFIRRSFFGIWTILVLMANWITTLRYWIFCPVYRANETTYNLKFSWSANVFWRSYFSANTDFSEKYVFHCPNFGGWIQKSQYFSANTDSIIVKIWEYIQFLFLYQTIKKSGQNF